MKCIEVICRSVHITYYLTFESSAEIQEITIQLKGKGSFMRLIGVIKFEFNGEEIFSLDENVESSTFTFGSAMEEADKCGNEEALEILYKCSLQIHLEEASFPSVPSVQNKHIKAELSDNDTLNYDEERHLVEAEESIDKIIDFVLSNLVVSNLLADVMATR
jgi:hypothetical protein